MAKRPPPLSLHNPGRLLRIPEIASALGVSARTVRRMIESGELIATDVSHGISADGRHQWRVSEYHLRQFTNRRIT